MDPIILDVLCMSKERDTLLALGMTLKELGDKHKHDSEPHVKISGLLDTFLANLRDEKRLSTLVHERTLAPTLLTESQWYHLLVAHNEEHTKEAANVLEFLQHDHHFWNGAVEVKLNMIFAQLIYDFVQHLVFPNNEPSLAVTPLQRDFFQGIGKPVWKWYLCAPLPSHEVLFFLSYLYEHLPVGNTCRLMFSSPSLWSSMISQGHEHRALLMLRRFPCLRNELASSSSLCTTILMTAIDCNATLLASYVWRVAVQSLDETLGHVNGREAGSMEEMWNYFFHPRHRGFFIPELLWTLINLPRLGLRDWLQGKVTTRPAITGLQLSNEQQIQVEALLQGIRDLYLTVVLKNKQVSDAGVDTLIQRYLEYVQDTESAVHMPLCPDVVCNTEHNRLEATMESSFWDSIMDKSPDSERYVRSLIHAHYSETMIPTKHRIWYLEVRGRFVSADQQKVDTYLRHWADDEEEDPNLGNVRLLEHHDTWPYDKTQFPLNEHLPQDGDDDGDEYVRMSLDSGMTLIEHSHAQGKRHAAHHAASRYKGKVMYTQPKFKKVVKKGFAGKEHQGQTGKLIKAPHDIKDKEKRKKAIKQILAIAYSEERKALGKNKSEPKEHRKKVLQPPAAPKSKLSSLRKS